jgi:hypothetical protein
MARETEAEPFLRVFPVVGGGFSFAWHLLTCLESRSLVLDENTIAHTAEQQTFWQTDHHNAGTCRVCRQYLKAMRVKDADEGLDSLRDLIWRATCCGRVKVAWQTGHLWSPPMLSQSKGAFFLCTCIYHTVLGCTRPDVTLSRCQGHVTCLATAICPVPCHATCHVPPLPPPVPRRTAAVAGTHAPT